MRLFIVDLQTIVPLRINYDMKWINITEPNKTCTNIIDSRIKRLLSVSMSQIFRKMMLEWPITMVDIVRAKCGAI